MRSAVCCAGLSMIAGAAELKPVPLESRITGVQPMTGIVLWATNSAAKSDAIRLEFSYVKYSDVVSKRGQYDWSVVEKLLDQAAGRGHQMVLRPHYVYPGREAAAPDYIRELPDYRETRAKSEGKDTTFCDWSHPELQEFTLAFYSEFAKRYDRDPRLAFLQTGFGLWAEYHIYDGPMELGKTFPSKEYQARFARHLDKVFEHTPWSISVDAANARRTPFAGDADLLALNFGVFDDSFLCKQHARENLPDWEALDRERWRRAPAGGEFSYYSDHDQQHALAPKGPHGIPFEKAAADFHLSYIIGDGQPKHASPERLREAGMACGYKFHITRFLSDPGRSEVTVANRGIAPIYHDAFVAVNGVRADRSLKGLLPGASLELAIPAGGAEPVLAIESDRLVPGMKIEFEASLK